MRRTLAAGSVVAVLLAAGSGCTTTKVTVAKFAPPTPTPATPPPPAAVPPPTPMPVATAPPTQYDRTPGVLYEEKGTPRPTPTPTRPAPTPAPSPLSRPPAAQA